MNKELCPVCGRIELVSYDTTNGVYKCCEHCHYNTDEDSKDE